MQNGNMFCISTVSILSCGYLTCSPKQRAPAWTDRILWRVNRRASIDTDYLSIEQLHYKSHSDMLWSDHRPVSSEFLAKVRMRTSNNSLTPPPPPLECTRGLHVYSQFLGKGGMFWLFLSERFSQENPEKGVFLNQSHKIWVFFRSFLRN